jgi:Tfp pilus assembly protein PilV
LKDLFTLLRIGAAALLFIIVGCKKQSADPAQAFQTANPEILVRWQQAMEATKTNNYVTAVLSLRKLQMDTSLTSEQQTAVTEQMAFVNQNLSAAEQRGDPDAKKAMEEIRLRWRFP